MAVESATFADIHLSEEDIKSRFIQPALEDKGTPLVRSLCKAR